MRLLSSERHLNTANHLKRQIMEYTVLLQPQRRGGFKATIPAFPTCRSAGATEAEALTNLRAALSKLLEQSKIGPLKSTAIESNMTRGSRWPECGAMIQLGMSTKV